MKIEAIASRGARKDFVDLYAIRQEGLALSGASPAFEMRFAYARPDVLHRLKALTYFEDAEREPELLMLKTHRVARAALVRRGRGARLLGGGLALSDSDRVAPWSRESPRLPLE